MSAEIKCSCNCCTFRISHTGKQTKGIFTPLIVRKDNQLAVKAICTDCGNSILLYDSKTDGARKTYHDDIRAFESFTTKGGDVNAWNIIIKYNYLSEKMKVENVYSNEFENCFIEIQNKGKSKALIEE